MCEVAVCEGDDGGHAGTRNHISEWKCLGVVCEHRNTQECVRGMETTTATEGRGPSSGRSCNGDRAGLAQQRARGSGRAWHEAYYDNLCPTVFKYYWTLTFVGDMFLKNATIIEALFPWGKRGIGCQ